MIIKTYSMSVEKLILIQKIYISSNCRSLSQKICQNILMKKLQKINYIHRIIFCLRMDTQTNPLIKFYFPEEKELPYFDHITTKQEMQERLIELSREDKYKDKKFEYKVVGFIKYQSRGSKKQNYRGIKVYFHCCGHQRCRPSITFKYNHQKRQHELMDHKTLHEHQLLTKIQEKENSNMGGQDINQKNHIQTELQDREFQFPLEQQIKKIKVTSDRSLKGTLSGLLRKAHHKDIKIGFRVKQSEQLKNTELYYYLWAKFDCCNGINDKPPYIHFIRHSIDQYYSLQHFQNIHCHKVQVEVNNRQGIKQQPEQLRAKSSFQKKKQIFLPQKVVKIENEAFLNKQIQKDQFLKGINSNLSDVQIFRRQFIGNFKNNNNEKVNDFLTVKHQIGENICYLENNYNSHCSQEQKGTLVSFWYGYFCQKLYTQLQTKSLQQIKLSQIHKLMIKQSQLRKAQMMNIDKNIWIQCGLQLFQYQNFVNKKIEINTNLPEIFDETQKFLFILKKNKLNELMNSQCFQKQITIFLGLFPIKIQSNQFNLMIAYTIAPNMQLILIWFSLTKNIKNNYESISCLLSPLSNLYLFEKVLQTSINFLNIQSTFIVFTTLNQSLFKSVEIVKSNLNKMNIRRKIYHSLHVLCVQDLIISENKNSDVLKYISNRISQFEGENIAFATFDHFSQFFKEKIQKNNQKQDPFNPRILFQQLNSFNSFFSDIPHQRHPHTIFSFLTNKLFNERKVIYIQDPIQLMANTLGSFNQFRNYQELFCLIITLIQHFNNVKLQKVDRMNKFVPYENIWQKNERLIYNLISKNNNLDGKNIFDQLKIKQYQFVQIVKYFPRIIVQTVYRLLYYCNYLKFIPTQNKIQPENKCVSETQTILELKVSDNQQQQIYDVKIQIPADETIISKKRFFCQCGFSISTGIPCQHQLYCAITQKKSIFYEIDQNLQKRF